MQAHRLKTLYSKKIYTAAAAAAQCDVQLRRTRKLQASPPNIPSASSRGIAAVMESQLGLPLSRTVYKSIERTRWRALETIFRKSLSRKHIAPRRHLQNNIYTPPHSPRNQSAIKPCSCCTCPMLVLRNVQRICDCCNPPLSIALRRDVLRMLPSSGRPSSPLRPLGI